MTLGSPSSAVVDDEAVAAAALFENNGVVADLFRGLRGCDSGPPAAAVGILAIAVVDPCD